jgi:hypothetical protein
LRDDYIAAAFFGVAVASGVLLANGYKVYRVGAALNAKMAAVYFGFGAPLQQCFSG